jgi:regulator of sirC expression with transglutaminase-like and TPR domain
LQPHLVHSFTHAALSPDPDLAVAALMIARVEYPKLDAGPYLDQLDALGHEARRRVESVVVVPDDVPEQVDPDRYARVMALNDYLFGELRFTGNELQYEDPRNSFLNQVLERRTGIRSRWRWSTWRWRGARASTSKGSISLAVFSSDARRGAACPIRRT